MAANASAQSNRQVWANITFDWVKPSGVTYEVDFEPKTLLSAPPGEPGWGNLDITPSVEYPVTNRSIWSVKWSSEGRNRPTISTRRK